MKIKLNKIATAKRKYDYEIEKITEQIKPFVKCNFFIDFQPSDNSHVIVNDDSQNALLKHCISVINKKGELTEDDYDNLTI